MFDLSTLAQAAPDMGWLRDIAGRALLVLQLGISAIFAVRVAADAGGAIAGGKGTRTAVKEAIAERSGWFIFIWVVGGIAGILLWIAGR